MGARTRELSAGAIAILPVLVATAPIALLFGKLPLAAGGASVVILRMLIG